MAKRIGRFRFQIETNGSGREWYVWYKEGLFGSRTYVIWENGSRFSTRWFESNWGIVNLDKAYEALYWAKDKARNILDYREQTRKSKIRKVIHKEP